jgi:hypothetical protein
MPKRFSLIKAVNIIAVLLISTAFVIPILFMILEFITDRRTSILYELFKGEHEDNQTVSRRTL